jgi:hypothetical protein
MNGWLKDERLGSFSGTYYRKYTDCPTGKHISLAVHEPVDWAKADEEFQKGCPCKENLHAQS